MSKIEEIAAKARAGEELTDEELEYVGQLIQKFAPLIEQTWQWLLPVVMQVVAIWVDVVKKLEDESDVSKGAKAWLKDKE